MPTRPAPLADGAYYGRISPVGLTRRSFRFTVLCRVESGSGERPRPGREVVLSLPDSVTPVIWFAPNGDYAKGHGQDADFDLWASVVAHPQPSEGLLPTWYVGIRHGAVYWVGEEIPVGQDATPCKGNGNAPP